MAVNDYLKSAATELMKAVDLVRQEIDQLKNEESNLHQLVDKEIAQLADQIRIHEHELRRPDLDQDKSKVQTNLRDLTTRIAERKRDLTNQQKQIQDIIQAKQGTIQRLETQSRSIMP